MKCKHPKVDASKRCKTCRELVDLTQKRNKLRNKPVWLDGIRFASGREGKRYLELKALAQAGKIFKLELQPEFEIDFNGVLICKVRPDFAYQVIDTNGGAFATSRKIVEDSKGFRTDVFILKKKLMLARYNIDVQEV